MYPKMAFFSGGGRVKWSKGTTLREYASAGVSHVKIGSTAGPSKIFAYKYKKN